ncbi:hypothetical protein P154DRAFT_520562 [Amniculicola lignicola CBS 123094]|uniref:Peptidase S54 rhomboid domain-containing protein n=1 Tax=Amniculicola lignicola CBS 123094 TaxID=1392246 RepID=A0A6A5WPH3_9PLEO|nr:hypothetical protein P154DRAFT_520562 [Amniculicola lignicola CBS 123094]
MSCALPTALLRPSCAALRPSAPTPRQWSSVTAAFARQFCSQKACRTRASFNVPSHRAFSSATPSLARIAPPPSAPRPPRTTASPKTRPVHIGGLPDGPVDANTIHKMFRGSVSPADGNAVLRILHHRRTSGSLADYGVDHLGPKYTAVTRDLAMRALSFLRQLYPTDEARAAEEWAEREANRIAYELWLADPENDSKYKDPARVFREQQQKELKKQGQPEEERIGMLHAGPSQFELNIKEQRQKRLEEAAKTAEEKEIREKEIENKVATGLYVRTPGGTQVMKRDTETAYVDIFGREQISRRKETHEKYQNLSHTPFKTGEEMLAATTLTQRFVPMTAFVAAVAFLCYGAAHYYEPPDMDHRLWPGLSPTTATIAAIVLTNVVICMLWRWTPFWPFMTRYLMHTPGYPRAFQAVGNIFSHVQYEHLLANMMSLAVFGALCHELVGRGTFMGTYISAGAVGTLFTLYSANFRGGHYITSHSLGASACLAGIMALYLLLTDQDSIKIPFLKDAYIPFFPKILAAFFISIDVYRAFKGKHLTVDHASHLGGWFVGASVAGYSRATGFHEKRLGVPSRRDEEKGVQERAQEGESGIVDLGAMFKEEAKEIKDAVTKSGK